MVDRRKKDLIYLASFVLIVFLVNIFSSYFFTRFDFTKEKRYTLSPITRNLIGKLKSDIQVTVYLEGDFPSGWKRLRNATRDLLIDLKAYSNGNLRYEFVNPLSGNADNQKQAYDLLISQGLEPLNLTVKTDEGMSQKIIFPAALITYHGVRMPVKLLLNRQEASPEQVLNNSIQNLEYAFTSAIKKITSEGKPRIGFTEGHGELSDLQLSDAITSLQDAYEVGRVDLNQITFQGLDKLKLLIVPKPNTAFTEAEKYKIDYFLMHGGRLFWALDNVNAELDSLRKGQGNQLTFPKKLNLDDILFKYGVRVNYDLVADLSCTQIPITVGNVSGQGQIQLMHWIFYPIFFPGSPHPLVKNLDGIRSEFASTVDTIAVKGINKQVILLSSPLNKVFSSPAMISLQMIEQEPDPRAFRSQPKPVGVLLEGNFPSDFKGRPVPEAIKETVQIPIKSKFTKMIVVGDGDILKNQISDKDHSPFPLGYDRYTQLQFGNKNFLLNIADYMTDDSGIMQLRTKEIKIRLLDKARIIREKVSWQVLNIGFPILLILLFGIFQYYYRKRKYAH
jgi:ABC-2 type transport system permease protein